MLDSSIRPASQLRLSGQAVSQRPRASERGAEHTSAHRRGDDDRDRRSELAEEPSSAADNGGVL